MISNFLVKREGWHKISWLAGRAANRGQQFVRHMQAKFGLLKSKKNMCKNFKNNKT